MKHPSLEPILASFLALQDDVMVRVLRVLRVCVCGAGMVRVLRVLRGWV